MATTFFDFMRHGEPVGGSRIRGQTDDPLNELGWQQMRAQVGENCVWHRVVSSPLSRCSAFASETAARFNLPLELDEQLKEIGFGVWEGLSRSELVAMQPDVLSQFWRDPLRHAPAGAEPIDKFKQRVGEAWQRLLTAHAGQRVLVVCHAGVIRMSLCQTLGFPIEHVFRVKVPYAGVTRFQVEQDEAGTMVYLLSHASGFSNLPS